MRMSRLVAAALLAVACLSMGAHAGGNDTMGRIVVGEPFPDIVLPSLKDGGPMSIAGFRGKRIFLHVFASW